MKSITIFDAVGKVNRIVSCPTEMIVHQLQMGEQYIDGTYDDNYYLDLVTRQVVAKPERPVGDVYFNIATKSWQPVVYATAQLIASAMAKRAALLAACDWTQLPDVPLLTQSTWQPYRQSLRDITLQPNYPNTIAWPTPPI
ncbi:MAG: tail fiber assembly protein [Methylotenera sp.]|nr:tail fiber assembly protein [Methylotenera sp.]